MDTVNVSGLGRAGQRGRRRCAAALLVALACCSTAAATLPEAVVQARDVAGRDPEEAHRLLARLRESAIAVNDWPLRLYVDEADCRILSDTSAIDGRRIAEAGIAAAASAPQGIGPIRLALLRLRACAGGLQLDLGETDRGTATLEDVLAESTQDRGLAAAHALALLERGLHRSRRGDLLQGQKDLLAACETIETLQLRQDLELCRAHLANHYKRMGDTDEALRLLEDLLEGARRRNANADIIVYVFGLAQVRYERHEWTHAEAAFAESIRLSKAANDRSGVAYSEHGLGYTLIQLNRPEEALVHAREALKVLADGSDPIQQLRTTLLEAKALSLLGRPGQAEALLHKTEKAVRASKDGPLLADWLLTRSEAYARLGAWREAYEALAEWRPLNASAQEQRLSEQTARLRLQFNRERDVAELVSLRRLNAKGDELVQAQRLALVLFLALLAAAIAYAARKVRHAHHLQRLALVDELTGLPNRRATLAYLEDQLRHARQLDQPLAVLMVDIDHFKRINDQHGHAKGDEVLRQVAQTLSAAVRQQDRAGRLGGEEFLVVLPGTPVEHAESIAERMRIAVELHHQLTSPGSVPVTISIGISVRAERDTVARLVARADEALYAAKGQGRNRVLIAGGQPATTIPPEPVAEAAERSS